MNASAIDKDKFIQDHNTFLVAKGYLNLTEDEKIKAISYHFKEIMETLGLDLTSESLQNTPHRVAKMYVQELFQGLSEESFPKISTFNNSYKYDEMLIEKDIEVFSYCEHHFMPFTGRAHVAYFPAKRVIGLSKINRLVKYLSRRPQSQERLTQEIAGSLKKILQNEDVAVSIEARHFCIAARGIEDTNSMAVTSELSGRFKCQEHRELFFSSIRSVACC